MSALLHLLGLIAIPFVLLMGLISPVLLVCVFLWCAYWSSR